MDTVDLSIIIPTYHTNNKMLLRCLQSVLEQRKQNIEIIIVDDGNSESYRTNTYNNQLFSNEKVKIIYQDNKGVAAARNAGVIVAKGEYITFVDADDIVMGDFFSESLLTAKKNDADVVIGGMARIYPNNSKENILLADNKVSVFNEDEHDKVKALILGGLYKINNYGGYVGRGPVSKIVKSDIAKRTKFDCSLSIYEDTVWNLDIIDQSKKICLEHKIWYGYYYVEQSATNAFHEDELCRSTVGMNAISKRIDFSIEELRRKFSEQCLLEYCRIVNSFFTSNKNKDSAFDKIKMSKEFLHRDPWNKIYEKKLKADMTRTMRMRSFLIRHNLWLPMKLLYKKVKGKDN